MDMFNAYSPEAAVVEVADAVLSIKHKGFQSEREVRYVVSDPGDPRMIRSPGPYVELTGGADRVAADVDPPYSTRRTSMLPIVAVRVGPGLRGELLEIARAVRASYRWAAVVQSTSTLRVA